MPEGLDFEELPSDHLFSLDLGTLCSIGDVRRSLFLARDAHRRRFKKPVAGFGKAFEQIDRSAVADEGGPFVSRP